jgi:hypothetical protein
MVKKTEEVFDEPTLTNLINHINKFNLATRSYRAHRKKPLN